MAIPQIAPEPPTSGMISQDSAAFYRPVVGAAHDAFKERLKTVVLFGSQARGDAKPGSDHDLLLVIEELPRNPVARLQQVRTAMIDMASPVLGMVRLVAKTPEEMACNLTPMMLDVCVDGVCLFGDDYFEPLRQKALAALRESGLRRVLMGGSLMWVFPTLRTTNWDLSWDGYREF